MIFKYAIGLAIYSKQFERDGNLNFPLNEQSRISSPDVQWSGTDIKNDKLNKKYYAHGTLTSFRGDKIFWAFTKLKLFLKFHCCVGSFGQCN